MPDGLAVHADEIDFRSVQAAFKNERLDGADVGSGDGVLEVGQGLGFGANGVFEECQQFRTQSRRIRDRLPRTCIDDVLAIGGDD